MDFMSEYKGLINYEQDCERGQYSPNNIKHLVVRPNQVTVFYHIPYRKAANGYPVSYRSSSPWDPLSDLRGVSGKDLCRVLLDPVCGSLESIVLMGSEGLAGKFAESLHILGDGIESGIAGRFKRLYSIMRVDAWRRDYLSDASLMLEEYYRGDYGSVRVQNILELLRRGYDGKYLYRNDGDWWLGWGRLRLYEKRPFDALLLKRFMYLKGHYNRVNGCGVSKGNLGLTPDICLKKINLILKTVSSIDGLLSEDGVDVVLMGLLRFRRDILDGKFAKVTEGSFLPVVERDLMKVLQAYREVIGMRKYSFKASNVDSDVADGEVKDIMLVWNAFLHGCTYSESVKMLGWE